MKIAIKLILAIIIIPTSVVIMKKTKAKIVNLANESRTLKVVK
jgi:hypothetical protein